MSTTNKQSVKDLVEKHWDKQGMCGSCSWHGAFYEYWLEEKEMMDYWNEDDKCFSFSCINSDVDDAYSHRGVRIYPTEKEIKEFNLRGI